MRAVFLLLVFGVGLAACTPAPPPALATDGKPAPKLYRIKNGQTAKIQFRVEDGVNALRQAAGVQPVSLNAKLNATAATHSRDMSLQNRPWHFGSDGSSPIDRTRRAGYPGAFMGELISETYEAELVTLGVWSEDLATRKVLLTPEARDLGFAWFQEDNGKIWWTLVLGGPGLSQSRQSTPEVAALEYPPLRLWIDRNWRAVSNHGARQILQGLCATARPMACRPHNTHPTRTGYPSN